MKKGIKIHYYCNVLLLASSNELLLKADRDHSRSIRSTCRASATTLLVINESNGAARRETDAVKSQRDTLLYTQTLRRTTDSCAQRNSRM